MPSDILPASAAAFAPQSSTIVVLNVKAKVEPWLTKALRKTSGRKRLLNNAHQHVQCLTETLSLPSAIWRLCSIMLPKAPESRIRQVDDPLIEAAFNHHVVHIEAYVIHVDLVLHNEVAFKLTPKSIAAMVEHHKSVHSVNIAANTICLSVEPRVTKLREDFILKVNEFIYRTDARALESLERGGAGELRFGRSKEVGDALTGLFVPLALAPAMRLPVAEARLFQPTVATTDEAWMNPSAGLFFPSSSSNADSGTFALPARYPIPCPRQLDSFGLEECNDPLGYYLSYSPRT